MRPRSILAVSMTTLLGGLLAATLVVSAASTSAVIQVNTNLDVIADDGLCSLREAIRAANLDQPSGGLPGECPGGNAGDTILLPAGVYQLTRNGIGEDAGLTGDLDITSTLVIRGAGADQTVIDAAGIDRAFHVPGTPFQFSYSASLWHLTIRNGNAGSVFGGALLNNYMEVKLYHTTISSNSASNGGGIFNSGGSARLHIHESTLRNNIANNGGGGGIWTNSGPVTVTQSAIFNNHATTHGGAIASAGGAVYLENTTLSGNTADFCCGAIETDSTLKLRNVTITANTADADADGSGDGGAFGQPFGGPPVLLANSIVAGNVDNGGEAPECFGVANSEGYNLLGNLLGCGISTTAGDVVGGPTMLGPLQNNGGPTLTHAPLPGSPAIDAGNPASPGSPGACPSVDQRKYLRPFDGDGNGSAICDIGAIEAFAASPKRVYLPAVFRTP